MAMWELAPGSPWNAIFSVLLMLSGFVALPASCSSRLAVGKDSACGFEVGRSVDAARHGIDDGNIDPHVRFQRAELFQLFLLFQRRLRQLHEALQRRAAVGVEADMVVAGAVAMRGGGA